MAWVILVKVDGPHRWTRAWPQVRGCALKVGKYKQSVTKSCGGDEFIDESMFYHTAQQLNIWSFVCIYERPILGENPKPHFLPVPWNLPDFMKSGGFQVKSTWNPADFRWNLVDFMLETFKSDNSRKELHFHRGRGEAMSFELGEICRTGYVIHTKDHLPRMVSQCFLIVCGVMLYDRWGDLLGLPPECFPFSANVIDPNLRT